MARNLHEVKSIMVSSPIQVLKSSASFDEHDLDVLNIRFGLVYEGVNKNGDRFTEAEIRNAYPTLIHKLINWEHDEPNIGVITKSELVEASADTPLHIMCEGTIMAWKYPEFAEMIVDAAEQAALGYPSEEVGLSMECYFHDANYVIGDYEQVIPMSEDVDGSMEFMRGRKLGGKLVSRELLGVFFGGAAVTATPAERRARLMAVASNKTETGKEIFASLKDSDFALPSLRMFPMDSRSHLEASLRYFEAVASQIGTEVTRAQLIEANERLRDAAEECGVILKGGRCLNCTCTDTSPLETISEGGIEHMGKKTKESVDEQVLAAEEADESVEVPVEEEAPAEVDAEEEAAPVEDAPDEAEPAAEDEPTEEPAAEAADFSIEGAVKRILEMLTEMSEQDSEPAEVAAEASDESASEDDKVSQLEAALDEARKEASAAKAELLGYVRFDKLTKAGVSVPEDKISEKKSFLASLDEQAWQSYYEDVATAAGSATEEDSVDSAQASALNLEEVAEEAPIRKYKSFWSK